MPYPTDVPAGILDRPKPGGIGGPPELPPPDYYRVSMSQLVNEIFRLRNRVHVLESSFLVTRLRAETLRGFHGGVGGPAEIPVPEGEGGSGWGGWNGPIPGEIHEIAELPINTLVTEISGLLTRFAQFEKSITQQLGQLTQRLDSMKK